MMKVLGRPLAWYPMNAALRSGVVDKAYMSTDDPELMALAEETGFEVIERPDYLATKEALGEDAYKHGYDVICERTGETPELLILLFCNAPTVTVEQIREGIEVLRDNPHYDSAITVSRYNMYSPLRARRVDEDGLLQPFVPFETFGDPRTLNCDRDSQGDVLFADVALSVIRPQNLDNMDNGMLPQKWMGQKIYPLKNDAGLDIDYVWQTGQIEWWLQQQGYTDQSTPYNKDNEPLANETHGRQISPAKSDSERRVLITTVPFGEPNSEPLDLLEAAGIDYVINPINRKLTEDELAGLIGDFGILIAGTEPITSKVMDAAPYLRLIARVGIGLDNVDLVAARARGIHVAYTPEAPSPAAAELAIGMMLSLLRNISSTDRAMHNGVWHRYMGRRLSEMTIGVIGVGRIGKLVISHLVGGFPGVKIIANDIAPDKNFGRANKVTWVEKETIYKEADIITLHLPLSPLTNRLIRADEMKMMKSDALLVNTSRGNMIDEYDLKEALEEKLIGGAAIDVFDHEPYSGGLSTLDNCLLTCHMGSMTRDCRYWMELGATEEVVRFVKHEPLERLVPELEYTIMEEGQ